MLRPNLKINSIRSPEFKLHLLPCLYRKAVKLDKLWSPGQALLDLDSDHHMWLHSSFRWVNCFTEEGLLLETLQKLFMAENKETLRQYSEIWLLDKDMKNIKTLNKSKAYTSI